MTALTASSRRISSYRRRAATSTEYMMIMALIVLPIALMMPMFMHMIDVYGTRIVAILGLPYP